MKKIVLTTDLSFYKTLLQEKISQKFLPHVDKTTQKWKAKEFNLVVDAISKTDFSSFSDTAVTLSSRTIRNFYNNELKGKGSFSILVLLVYAENEAFLDYFASNYSYKLELAWDAFISFTALEKIKVKEPKKEIKHNIRFSDALFFLYNLVNNKPNYLLLFFLFIYPFTIIVWAVLTNVWTGIDYALDKSMSVYIGYFFYAISATQLTLFNVEYKKLMQITPFNEKVLNNNFKYISLFISAFISAFLHYSFLKDDLFGWCESETGVISYLGIYHFTLYTFNLWIIFNFQYYFSRFNKLIKPLHKIDMFSKNELIPFISKVLDSLSALNIIYKNILISYGGFSILFFISLIIFEMKQPVFHLDLWQWIEIAIIMIFYVLFGFILYWNFFNKTISHFLKSTKQKLLDRDLENISFNNYVLSLPQTANHIDEYKSSVRNSLIWVVILFTYALNFSLPERLSIKFHVTFKLFLSKKKQFNDIFISIN